MEENVKRLKEDYTSYYRDYGEITVPKGVKTSTITSLGVDVRYNFVNEFDWIEEKYASISGLLRHDIEHYGLNVPSEYLE